MLRAERVDPADVAETAERILGESWEPPCLNYSADYLRWQLNFPGPSPSRAVVALDGGEPAGFAALTPRRLRFRRQRLDAFILSFVAVRPAWRGQGVGSLLYTALLDGAKTDGVPIVAFAEPESAGRALLLKSFEANHFLRKGLGTFRAHAGLSRPGPSTSLIRCSMVEDLAGLSAALDRCDDSRTLLSDPTLDQWEHYRKDPRGRALVEVWDPDGEPAGSAMIVMAEVITAQGFTRTPLIDSIWTPHPSPEALKAIVQFAGGCSGQGGPQTITLPNVGTLDEFALRAAGLRAIPSRFEGFLFLPDPRSPVDEADSTNIEIV